MQAFYDYLESDVNVDMLSPDELMTRALSIANLDLIKGEEKKHHH